MSTTVQPTGELIEDVRRIGPLLDAEAAEGEAIGSLTEPVIKALIDGGFIMAGAPKEFGGAEVSAVEFLEMLEELGRFDGAAGWCMMAVGSHAGVIGSALPASGAEKLFSVGTPRTAGMPAPRGRAVRVDGGVEFTGKHQFASGSCMATHFIAGGLVYDGDSPVMAENGFPEMLAVIVPKADVREMGNWDVMGMEATASIDYEIGPLFVPDDMVWPLNPWPSELPRGGPYWRMGVDVLGPIGHSGVALGMARRALEEIALLAPTRKRIDVQFPTTADQPRFQHDLALLDVELRAARTLFHETVRLGEAHVAEHGGPSPQGDVHRIKQGARLIHDVGVRCVDFAYEWSGSAGLRNGHVIGRLFRNMHAINQHVVLDRNILNAAAPYVIGELAAGRSV